MHMPSLNSIRPRRQRGAILVTSLLLLVVLTVLGVAMMRMTNMQERMAGNARDVNLALQGAEAALRAGEDRLSPATLTARPLPTTGVDCVFCARDTLPVAIYDRGQYDWTANAQEYGDPDEKEMADLARDPRYTIAELGFAPDGYGQGQDPPTGRDFYQITGFSSGASDQANVVLQSTFPRRF
jgi:type IV pilus assembly protein PilX